MGSEVRARMFCELDWVVDPKMGGSGLLSSAAPVIEGIWYRVIKELLVVLTEENPSNHLPITKVTT